MIALTSSCSSSRPEFAVDVPFASRYVSRGAVIDDDPVIQPSVAVAQELKRGSLNAALWSNLELNDDRNLENRFVEVDTTVDYGVSLGRLDLTVGAARYDYPRTGDSSTTELYALTSINGLQITPALELWYDIDEGDGAYVNVNFSRSFELGGSWSLYAVASLGWMEAGQADYYYGVPSSALSDVQVQAVATYPLTDNVSFNLITVWSSVVDESYRDAVDEPDNLVLGTGFAMTF